MEKEKVYFVYLGKQLPYYAKSSLILAKKHSGLDVQLIGNQTQKKQIKNLSISFTSLEDFYDASKFKYASRVISSPTEYRDGFWLKTLERFFVLEQFMKFVGINKIFHAELDQVLFRADKLIENLNLIGKTGIFIPFHSKHVAVASILYCNNFDAMQSLINFSTSSKNYPNEMELLASWVYTNPNFGFKIPSILDFVDSSNYKSDSQKINLNETNGIADGVQIGMWVAGIDPRNVPIFKKPFNKFVDPPEPQIATKEHLSRLSFSFNQFEGYLEAELDGKTSVRIFNLHIHSKIHNYLNKFGALKLVELANSEKPVLLWPARYRQIKFALNKTLFKSLINPIKIFQFYKQIKKLQ